MKKPGTFRHGRRRDSSGTSLRQWAAYQLLLLERKMETTGQWFGIWKRTLADGTRVVVSVNRGGPNTIRQVMVNSQAWQLEEEVVVGEGSYRGLISIPAAEEAEAGWINGNPDGLPADEFLPCLERRGVEDGTNEAAWVLFPAAAAETYYVPLRAWLGPWIYGIEYGNVSWIGEPKPFQIDTKVLSWYTPGSRYFFPPQAEWIYYKGRPVVEALPNILELSVEPPVTWLGAAIGTWDSERYIVAAVLLTGNGGGSNWCTQWASNPAGAAIPACGIPTMGDCHGKIAFVRQLWVEVDFALQPPGETFPSEVAVLDPTAWELLGTYTPFVPSTATYDLMFEHPRVLGSVYFSPDAQKCCFSLINEWPDPLVTDIIHYCGYVELSIGSSGIGVLTEEENEWQGTEKSGTKYEGSCAETWYTDDPASAGTDCEVPEDYSSTGTGARSYTEVSGTFREFSDLVVAVDYDKNGGLVKGILTTVADSDSGTQDTLSKQYDGELYGVKYYPNVWVEQYKDEEGFETSFENTGANLQVSFIISGALGDVTIELGQEKAAGSRTVSVSDVKTFSQSFTWTQDCASGTPVITQSGFDNYFKSQNTGKQHKRARVKALDLRAYFAGGLYYYRVDGISLTDTRTWDFAGTTSSQVVVTTEEDYAHIKAFTKDLGGETIHYTDTVYDNSLPPSTVTSSPGLSLQPVDCTGFPADSGSVTTTDADYPWVDRDTGILGLFEHSSIFPFLAPRLDYNDSDEFGNALASFQINDLTYTDEFNHPGQAVSTDEWVNFLSGIDPLVHNGSEEDLEPPVTITNPKFHKIGVI